MLARLSGPFLRLPSEAHSAINGLRMVLPTGRLKLQVVNLARGAVKCLAVQKIILPLTAILAMQFLLVGDPEVIMECPQKA